MELHDLELNIAFSHSRELAGLAILKKQEASDVAHDETTGRDGDTLIRTCA